LEVGKAESEDGAQLGGFSGEGWTPEKDVRAFVSILLGIVFGDPQQDDASIHTSIPAFVSEMIGSGLSPLSISCYSFNTILEILKQNDFKIEDGVDSAEVSSFVNWVESAE
jgi:hypothetical protein